MNKEELIELKERLQSINKKYTSSLITGITPKGIGIEPSDEYKTSGEIVSQIDDLKSLESTVNYVETKLEEIIRNAVQRGVEFDGIIVPMCIRYFISKKMSDEIDTNCFLKPEKFTTSEILNGIVEVSFNYDFINGLDRFMNADDYLNNSNESYDKTFVLDYEKFVKLLLSRGFEVDIHTFDNCLRKSLSAEHPVIIVNLVKENKKGY